MIIGQVARSATANDERRMMNDRDPESEGSGRSPQIPYLKIYWWTVPKAPGSGYSLQVRSHASGCRADCCDDASGDARSSQLLSSIGKSLLHNQTTLQELTLNSGPTQDSHSHYRPGKYPMKYWQYSIGWSGFEPLTPTVSR